MPATVDGLKVFLGLAPASSQDAEAMTAAVAAANSKAHEMRPDVTLDADGTELASWPADIDQGAVLLAAKLYGRRGSIGGVAAFTETGVAYVPRLDPDVRLLWSLGEFQSSVVA